MEATAERQLIMRHGAKSLLFVPILQDQKDVGILGVSRLREGNDWPEETVNFLSLGAEIFGSAMKRRQRGKIMSTLLRIAEAVGTSFRILFPYPGQE